MAAGEPTTLFGILVGLGSEAWRAHARVLVRKFTTKFPVDAVSRFTTATTTPRYEASRGRRIEPERNTRYGNNILCSRHRGLTGRVCLFLRPSDCEHEPALG